MDAERAAPPTAGVPARRPEARGGAGAPSRTAAARPSGATRPRRRASGAAAPPLRPGAAVEASDGRLGTVEEVVVRPASGELAYLVVRRGWTDRLLHVAAEAVDRVEGESVRLRVTRAEAERRGAGVPPEAAGGAVARQEGDRVVVPILEERLGAEVRPVALGELRVHKRVETEEARVTQEVARDELIVERVPVNRPLEAPAASRVEGDWFVVPIMEEVLVVRKQLMLKEEVRIRRQPVTEPREVRETLRRERVELEDATRHGARGAGAGARAAPPEPKGRGRRSGRGAAGTGIA
jgi:uncharacterized protein (TIGR02271 family)